jgi:hypothetical protein
MGLEPNPEMCQLVRNRWSPVQNCTSESTQDCRSGLSSGVRRASANALAFQCRPSKTAFNSRFSVFVLCTTCVELLIFSFSAISLVLVFFGRS